MFFRRKKASEPAGSESVAEKLQEALLAGSRRLLDEPDSEARVEALKKQYPGFSRDKHADLLIQRAKRNTAREGFASALAVTAAEATIPESAGLATPLALAGAGTAALADISYTTMVQMRLVLNLATLYECPFHRDDDEDVWWLFLTALGMRTAEEATRFTGTVAKEATTRAFRKWLRTGVRRALQEWVRRKAGERVARYLAERYLLRLVPLANMALSTWLNYTMTNRVALVAKRACKIRSGLFKPLAPILEDDSRYLVLPLIFWMGAETHNETDEFLALYSNASRRLQLTAEEQARAEELQDRIEDLTDPAGSPSALLDELSRLESPALRNAFVGVALTTAAIAGPKAETSAVKAMTAVAAAMRLDFNPDSLHTLTRHYKA